MLVAALEAFSTKTRYPLMEIGARYDALKDHTIGTEHQPMGIVVDVAVLFIGIAHPSVKENGIESGLVLLGPAFCGEVNCSSLGLDIVSS